MLVGQLKSLVQIGGRNYLGTSFTDEYLKFHEPESIDMTQKYIKSFILSIFKTIIFHFLAYFLKKPSNARFKAR
jgi:hypothetical protein